MMNISNSITYRLDHREFVHVDRLIPFVNFLSPRSRVQQSRNSKSKNFQGRNRLKMIGMDVPHTM
jgi:hypothetical protein